MIVLDKLEKIDDLRTVWIHEAKDFTPWLAEDDNIAMLGDTLGLDLSVEQIEAPVGGFNVDILAREMATDQVVIIENQLEETNHDHLGKAITYAAGKKAEIIIWIVKKAREEHRAAVEWLNDHSDENIAFFLLEIELWKIGNSSPAVKFNVVERPNDWEKEIKKDSLNLTDTQVLKLDYWTEFNRYAFEDEEFAKYFKKKKATAHHWYNVSIGSSEYNISFTINTQRNRLAVEFYISNNKELFHELYSQRDQIESDFGKALDWRELPSRKASRILLECNANIGNKNEWIKQFDWIKENAVSLHKTMKKYL